MHTTYSSRITYENAYNKRPQSNNRTNMVDTSAFKFCVKQRSAANKCSEIIDTAKMTLHR